MAALPREPGELTEGTRLLDRYVIVDRVAGGGMASIYRATDERLRRVVCVKLLRLVLEPGSTSGDSVYQATYAHFLQEALALSRLQHPNTLKIYDFGYLEDSGRPFQISEYLDGGTLDDHVKNHGAIVAADALSILDPIGGALTEAHSQGIIHRDIKPSNILFGRIGMSLVPKLADFGIAHSNVAKRAGSAPDEEEAVSIVSLFSPRWAAPEQLAGGSSGPATDVYSLALVSQFMLTGETMFPGKHVRATFPERVLGDDLVRRRLEETGVPEGVLPALLSAMSARPENRTPTVVQFLADVRAGLSGSGARRVEPSMPPPPVPEPIPPPPRLPSMGGTPAAPVIGRRPPRIVDVDDSLDLSVPAPANKAGSSEARIRITVLPSLDGYKAHVKGLNCFILRDGRPSTAAVVEGDEMLSLMSSAREDLGRIRVSIGTVRGDVRVFPAFGDELLLPLSVARRAAAVQIESTGEIVVVCQRS